MQIIAYKKVNKAKFVKLFTHNIGLMFDLMSADNKAFIFLFWLI